MNEESNESEQCEVINIKQKRLFVACQKQTKKYDLERENFKV